MLITNPATLWVISHVNVDMLIYMNTMEVAYLTLTYFMGSTCSTEITARHRVHLRQKYLLHMKSEFILTKYLWQRTFTVFWLHKCIYGCDTYREIKSLQVSNFGFNFRGRSDQTTCKMSQEKQHHDHKMKVHDSWMRERVCMHGST